MRQLVITVFAAGVLFAGAGEAQETPDRLAQVYACAEISEESARLACFDAAVAALRSADEEGDFVSVDRSQVETLEREAFGFSLPSLPRLFGGDDEPDGATQAAEDTRIDAITAAVTGIDSRADGRMVFTLANGQRWVQVEADRMRNVREGDTITIRRASLGSFFLEPESGRGTRVRREE